MGVGEGGGGGYTGGGINLRPPHAAAGLAGARRSGRPRPRLRAGRKCLGGAPQHLTPFTPPLHRHHPITNIRPPSHIHIRCSPFEVKSRSRARFPAWSRRACWSWALSRASRLPGSRWEGRREIWGWLGKEEAVRPGLGVWSVGNGVGGGGMGRGGWARGAGARTGVRLGWRARGWECAARAPRRCAASSLPPPHTPATPLHRPSQRWPACPSCGARRRPA